MTLTAIGDAYTTPRGDIVQFMQRPDARQAKFLVPPATAADWMDWSNHCSALFVNHRTPEALIAAEIAVAKNRNATTLLNLGIILETMGRFREALPLAAEAHHLDASDPFVSTWYSDALLRAGQFRSAWPLYTKSHADWSWLRAAIPEWDGKSTLAGKRLLVLSAGGYGDNILFFRWMPFLKALGATVTYMCPKPLVPLVNDSPCIHRCITGSVAGLDGTLIPSEYDLFTCILALGEYFCPDVSDIPAPPYLKANPEKSSYRGILRGHAGIRPLIGICTRAGEEKFPRRHRSLNADQIDRILTAGDRSLSVWVSLDYEAPLHSHINPNDALHIKRLVLNPVFHDWSDTAAIIDNLDLVITVDTGVAHLAGAMGKPTWVLLPGISAPYYMSGGYSTPFYPSMELFRNRAEGMDNAIAALCRKLEQRA